MHECFAATTRPPMVPTINLTTRRVVAFQPAKLGRLLDEGEQLDFLIKGHAVVGECIELLGVPPRFDARPLIDFRLLEICQTCK